MVSTPDGYDEDTAFLEQMIMTRDIEIKNLHNDVQAIRFTSGMTCLACYSFILSNLCAMALI